MDVRNEKKNRYSNITACELTHEGNSLGAVTTHFLFI